MSSLRLLAECKLADVNMAEGVRQIRVELRDALDELEDSRRQQARYADEVAPVIAEMRKALETLKDIFPMACRTRWRRPRCRSLNPYGLTGMPVAGISLR